MSYTTNETVSCHHLRQPEYFTWRRMKSSGALLLGMLVLTYHSSSLSAPVVNMVAGEVERITVDNPADTWSGGTMVVGGQNIIIPRNLVMDLPANRLTLQQLFTNRPEGCPADETGLAKGDSCNGSFTGAVATILANRNDNGNVIAGDVFLDKATEAVTGIITYINYDEGYFRVNGSDGDPATGAMIRVNDPEGRHTHQTGLGCGGGANCSADSRYGVDPDNYTFTASTGYPMCIPSTFLRGPFDFDENHDFTIDPAETGLVAVGTKNGANDALCPETNRPNSASEPVADSRLFAPIQIGDHVNAEGNFETIGGATFLSAHTVHVSVNLATLEVDYQPDYLVFDEVEWDVAGYQNERARVLMIGFTSLPDPGIEVFAMHSDPATDSYQELIMGTTRGCDSPLAAGLGSCTAQGIGVNASGIFKIVFDVDFPTGVPIKAVRSPCQQLNAAIADGGVPAADGTMITTPRCSATPTLEQELAMISPPSRDVIGRSRHKHTLHSSVVTLDLHGNETSNGEYVNPVGIGHPEFGEIDLSKLETPLIFTLPWNMDRRLGPGGCDGACTSTGIVPIGDESMALDPFPFSNLDPGEQAGASGVPIAPGYFLERDRSLSYWPLTSSQVLPWPPIDPAAVGITPTDHAGLLCPVLHGGETDTDGDGVGDSIDNCIEIANADQRNTDADLFGNICDADLDNNGIVNLVDYNLFRPSFGQTAPLSAAAENADFNGDGIVNLNDFSLFRSMFAQPPGP